jgi:hypothetical protein
MIKPTFTHRQMLVRRTCEFVSKLAAFARIYFFHCPLRLHSGSAAEQEPALCVVPVDFPVAPGLRRAAIRILLPKLFTVNF